MAVETWLAFLAATAVMLAIPGPTILLVIGQSLGAGAGRRCRSWPGWRSAT